MDNSTATNLFLAVAAGAVIILTLLIVGLLVYLFLFIRRVKKMASQAQRATEHASAEIQNLYADLKHNGFNFRSIISFIFGLVGSKKNIKKGKK